MEPAAAEPAEGAAPAAVSEESPEDIAAEGANIVPDEQAMRPAEEANMLLIAVAGGMLIGFFFLVYVVLAIANPSF
ncbi:MAG: hypothetical protein ACRDFS_13260 [Chloroflexota bacterium]